MLRSLYTGVSGLLNHQVRMDVLAHNISNVNTAGYKKERVVFQDMLSQMMSGAARPNEVRGGINPKQVGLGVNVAAIDKIMTQGAMQTTGKNTDVAVQGEGFFIEKNGDRTFYSRAGNFNVDADGILVNPATGMKIQGWEAVVQPDGSNLINPSGPISDIHIPIGGKTPARETQSVQFASNLNSITPLAVDPNNPTDEERSKQMIHQTAINVYDSQGGVHKLNVEFNRISKNQWRAVVNVDGALPGSTRVDVGNPTPDSNNVFLLNFDNNGTLVSAQDSAGQNPDTINQGMLSANLSFNVDNGALDAQGNPLGQQQTVRLDLGTVGQVDGITQFESNTTTKAYKQDGVPMGYLESFQIDPSGTILGVYTNGDRKELAQVALATFVNPQGLEKAGNTNFLQSSNSGLANIGTAGSAGKGEMVAGALEMSNVNLSEEFTDLIVTQRGFQANSRSITTSDTLLEEILRLKR
jgi:flagellar hook protein FlgE